VLAIARYQFIFKVKNSIRLPEYAGSALRGAFGHALRHLACMTRAKTCTGCLLSSNCPYIQIFEPQQVITGSLRLATPPVPYVIEPPAWGERHYSAGEEFVFHFTLIGQGLEYLPLCIMAWRRAFLRGVGAGDGTAELLRLLHITPTGDTCIYQPDERIIEHVRQLSFDDKNIPNTVDLEFITPLRLQENGRALPPSRLTPRTLLTALLRRVSLHHGYSQGQALYTSVEFSTLALAASQINSQVHMEWRDWTRRSARQQCTMQLGGCIGTWTLSGDLAPFWNFLCLGIYLHVGKEASFGLGQYHIIR
jgi:hypothetical protein